MFIILALIWLILSLFALYAVNEYYYWDKWDKVLIAASIFAFILNGWMIYDPSQMHMVVTIDTNPTWEAALWLSLVEGVCITGPIAGIYILIQKLKKLKYQKDNKDKR